MKGNLMLNSLSIEQLKGHLKCWQTHTVGKHKCNSLSQCMDLADIMDDMRYFSTYQDLAPKLQDYIIKRELDELINEDV